MYKVINGNNIDILKSYPDNHFDSIVTDPPYGIEFLAKEWDKNTGAVETWQECFRVLKPGGFLLAFSAARTYHHLATNIEGVGFEIRDQLMWLYSSGFPKAQDVGKGIDKREGKDKKYTYHKHKHADTRAVKNSVNHTTPYCIECDANMTYPPSQCDRLCNAKSPPIESEWAGWKTALKPAHEPIVMARKPMKGSTIANVLKHGVGALNIDATRVESETLTYPANGMDRLEFNQQDPNKWQGETTTNEQGRFPSNVLGEVEGYQKFFYCPKVSRAERHCGFEAPPEEHNKDLGKNETHGINVMGKTPFCDDCKKTINGTNDHSKCDPSKKTFIEKRKSTMLGNNHPTVKPVALMRYLIKLVTPQGGKVLDPFTGSGSTGMAAVELGCEFTGCELDPAYVKIANTRIQAWKEKTDTAGHKLPEEWFIEE